MKKIDTHVHTSEVSSCGKLTAAQIVESYVAAGYDAIVITDHLLLGRIAEQQLSAQEVYDRQLRGYRAACECARGRIGVLLGAEIRFTQGNEDYLLLGLDERKYMELARELPDSPAACHALMQRLDCLMYQAHPFRPGLRTADPGCLDGVEVFNGNPRHDSHNELAMRFALDNGLRMSSGSDAHQPTDIARGGIIAPDWVDYSAALVRFLRDTPRPEMITAAD